MIGLHPRGLNLYVMRPAEEKSLRDHTPKTTNGLTCSYPFGVIFLCDFRFHYVIYPHLYMICNPLECIHVHACAHAHIYVKFYKHLFIKVLVVLFLSLF